MSHVAHGPDEASARSSTFGATHGGALGEAWVEPDPFPLVRPAARERRAGDLDVVFDNHSFARAPGETSPAPVAWEPYPESERAVSPRRPHVRRWVARGIFTVIFAGIVALLAYELWLLVQTGFRAF